VVKHDIETIVLTGANIRNSYIRIRQVKSLLPKRMSEKEMGLSLELDGVGSVKTRVDIQKGILSERGATRRFFEVHKLSEGDRIDMEKVGTNHFKITTKSGDDMSNLNVRSTEGGEGATWDSDGNLPLFEKEKVRKPIRRAVSRTISSRANELDGREWTCNSISVWKDIRKTATEKGLHHPAMFPVMLVEKLIKCFTISSERIILDPFMGSGSTLVGACSLGRRGVGFEVYDEYVELAKQRLLRYTRNEESSGSYLIYPHDAKRLGEFVDRDSVDLCVTSPPYWDILSQRRSADYKETRDYGDLESDVSQISDYGAFIRSLGKIFSEVLKALKPGKYCVVNVMDLRKGKRFYCFHADLATELQEVGYLFDDIIIWDRSHDYNNLRPLGYPAVFRINKVHEYLLIFQKPKTKVKGKYGTGQS